MPYSSIDQLPAPIRSNLPVPAQRIFVKAFNSWYNANPEEDEVTAFKVGWAAVKRKYHKVNGKWTRKSASKGARSHARAS